MSEHDQQPILKVVNADATPEEVAAIIAVFSALGGGEPAKPKPRSTPPRKPGGPKRGR